MKPEDLISRLQQAVGTGIRSVILYGSAAAGDYVGRRSDYNLLVVVDRLGVRELAALARPCAAWRKAGNPTPLFFTLERLQKSADVFPIELMDIRQSHRILYGENVLERVEVHPENLRLLVEHELKSTLIRLREAFLLTDGKPQSVAELMMDSLSSILVLFRAALRLYQAEVPARKIDALEALGVHVRFNTEIFMEIEAMKEGRRDPKSVDALALFETYLQTVEAVVDRVDAHVHGSTQHRTR